MHNSNNQNLIGGHQAQQSPGRDFYGAREDSKGQRRSRQGLYNQGDVNAEMMGQSGSIAAYHGEYQGERGSNRLSGGRNSQSSLSKVNLQTVNPQADKLAQAYLNRRKANNSRRSRVSRQSLDHSQYSNNQSAARKQIQVNKSHQNLDHQGSVEYNDILGSREDLHNTSIVSDKNQSSKITSTTLEALSQQDATKSLGVRRKSAGVLTQSRPLKQIREYAQVTQQQRDNLANDQEMNRKKQKILSKINCQNPYVVRKTEPHHSSTLNTGTVDHNENILNEIEFQAYTPATAEGHNGSIADEDHVNYASVNKNDQLTKSTPMRSHNTKNPYLDNKFEQRSSQKQRFLEHQKEMSAEKAHNMRSEGRSSAKRSKSGREAKRQEKYLNSLLQDEEKNQQISPYRVMDDLRNQNQTLPVEQIESLEVQKQSLQQVDDNSSSDESDEHSRDSQEDPKVLKNKAKKKIASKKKSPKYAKKNSPSKKVSMAAARVSPKKDLPGKIDRKMSQSVMSQNYMMSQMSPSKKSPVKSKKGQRNYENNIRHSTAAYRNDDLIDVNDDLQIFDKNFQSSLKSTTKKSPMKSTISFSQKKQKPSPAKKQKREASPQRKTKEPINQESQIQHQSPKRSQPQWAKRKKCTSETSSRSSETSQTAQVTKQKVAVKAYTKKRAVRNSQKYENDSEGDLSVSATIEATHQRPYPENLSDNSPEGDKTLLRNSMVEASNSSNTGSKQESSDKKIKSIRFQKDMIALKLNQRLKKLNSQKLYGDEQFDRAKVQLKDFYKQIRNKIDEQEAKSSNELRGNLFIRQQNFSRMINQVQFQLDQLKSQLEPNDLGDTGKSFLSQTQTFEYTKNNANQVMYQADAFLGVEKELASGSKTNKISDQNLFDQEDLLESSQEEKNPINMLSYPNYSSEVLAKLIKVEYIAKLNCEKFDFINQPRAKSKNKFLNLTMDKNSMGATLSSMNTQKINEMIKTPSSKYQSPLKQSISQKNQSYKNKEDSNKSKKYLSQNKWVSQKDDRSSSEESSYSSDGQNLKKKQVNSRKHQLQDSKKRNQISNEKQKKSIIDNYQKQEEPSQKYQSIQSQVSPSKMQSNRSQNFKSMINVSPPKKATAANKTNGDLIEDLDFDLDQKLLEALKKHKKEERKLNNKNLKPKLLTEKSMISIQNHIQRIQTTSSMETLERNGAGSIALGSSQLLNQSKSLAKDIKLGGVSAMGGFLQPPHLSNMKYHPGHTFGKSDLNSRRAPIQEKSESLIPKAMSNSFMMPDQNQSQRNFFSKKQENQKNSASKSPTRNKQDSKHLSKIIQKSTSEDQLQTFKNNLQVAADTMNKSPKKKSPKKQNKQFGEQDKKRAMQTDRDDDQGSSHAYWKSSKHRHAKSITDYNLSRVVGPKQGKSLKQNDDLMDVVAQENTQKNDLKHKRRTSQIPQLSQQTNDQSNQLSNQTTNKTLNKSTYNENTGIPQIIKSSQVVRREGSVHSFHSNQDLLNTSNSNKFNIDKARANVLQQKATANKVAKNIIQREDKKVSQKQPEEQSKNIKKDQKNKQIILMTAASSEEQEALNEPEDQHTRQRIFTKIISQADRVQFQWSHPNTNQAKNLNDLQYILEYGCGIKFRGVEQFRKIYQGKAHKCIVADLMPKTTYRFRVKSVKIDQTSGQTQIIEEGNWSEIIGVTTLEA